MRKIAVIFLTLLFSAALIPVFAKADSPPTPNALRIDACNVPTTVYCFDILIPENLKGVHFGSVNPEFRKAHPELMASELSSYHENGYISYSMYFQNADSSMKPMDSFARGDYYLLFGEGNFSMLQRFKIVAIDRGGNILQISPAVTLKPKYGGFYVYVSYDYSKNTASPYFYNKMAGLFFWDFIRILFSVAIETLLAIPFGIRPLRAVAGVNFVSEIILTIGIYCFSLFYVAALIIFETLVVLIEFFGLMKFSRLPKPLRTAAFVLASNTITLGLGLWINIYGIFKA